MSTHTQVENLHKYAKTGCGSVPRQGNKAKDVIDIACMYFILVSTCVGSPSFISMPYKGQCIYLSLTMSGLICLYSMNVSI